MLLSTQGQSPPVSWREAVFRGLPPDNGLYLPTQVDPLPPAFFETLPDRTLPEIGAAVAGALLGDAVPAAALTALTRDALSFEAPLVRVDAHAYALELFHGPTLAFKDFGARFMARLMAHFLREAPPAENVPLTILVATSGDTGGAVARGFLGVPGIEVVILFPAGQVSPLQQRQLTTVEENVTALEIAGTFDDCQRLVKQAFLDEALRRERPLSSANSINIARLVPQSFYYFHAYAELRRQGVLAPGAPLTFCTPSGNFGNLCGGVLAWRLGLPVGHLVAATNANDVVPAYLRTAVFAPRSSVRTLSNAMDVGNPSNFVRLLSLFDGDAERLRAMVSGFAYSDDDTAAVMQAVLAETGYLLEPHGAIGYAGLRDHQRAYPNASPGVFLATAHPAKFAEAVTRLTGRPVPLPPPLRELLGRPERSVRLPARYEALRAWLLG